jgi:Ca2+-binding RTX toxin-like protein
VGTPIVILAGQSNAGRIAGEVTDALDAAYGAGNYVLVRAFSSGAPLTSARDGKSDWETPGEMRSTLVQDTVDALSATPDGYVAGILWVQGEADTDGSGTPSDYAGDFHALFDEFRDAVSAALGSRSTGVESAPIAIANLSDHAPAAPDRQNWQAIQTELTRLGDRNADIVTVDPDALSSRAGISAGEMFTDGLHYSDPASVALANGLVAALIALSASGTGGADRLIGTSGNDVFVVDHVDDVIVEESNGGTDLVRASVSFSLRDFGLVLENLTLTGTGNLSGTGNGIDNVLTGNGGNNALNGAWGNDVLYGMAGNDTLQDTRGNDTLVGGTGNDVYHIDSAEDVVIEHPGEGHDRINASISYRLWADAPDVEDLVLTGSGNLSGIGNALDNLLVGNSGANLLDGARGADRLEGGGGNDTLIGQSGADTLLGQGGNDMLYGDELDGASKTFQAGQAFRLYQATLDRAPDVSGFDYWTDQLKAGADYFGIVAGFVQSPEFQRAYGSLSNGDFVELLYNNVLDRASDPGGRANWLAQLENGASRELVVSKFAESVEFTNKTRQELNDWVRENRPDDVLTPGDGDSTLSGGDLSDTFVFGPGSDGTHVITDFEGWDRLDLRGFDYGSMTEARAEFRQVGSDLVFDDAGVTVVLEDTSLSDLSDGALWI